MSPQARAGREGQNPSHWDIRAGHGDALGTVPQPLSRWFSGMARKAWTLAASPATERNETLPSGAESDFGGGALRRAAEARWTPPQLLGAGTAGPPALPAATDPELRQPAT